MILFFCCFVFLWLCIISYSEIQFYSIYCNTVIYFKEGEWEGENDGTYGNQRLFSCPPGTGMFVSVNKLRPVHYPTSIDFFSSVQQSEARASEMNKPCYSVLNSNISRSKYDRRFSLMHYSKLNPGQQTPTQQKQFRKPLISQFGSQFFHQTCAS